MFAATRKKKQKTRDDLTEDEGAEKIQALWRGKKARKDAAERKERRLEELRRLEEENERAFARKVPPHWLYPNDVQLLRFKLFDLFEEPTSSIWAQILSVLILATIVFSILCFMLETMPEMRGVMSEDDWAAIEMVCTIIFSAEYVIRLWVCDVLKTQTVFEFLRNPPNVFDLLAILPFYMKLAASSAGLPALRVFRAVRLIRLTRIFKLGRYSSGMRLMVEAVRNSLQALWVLAFFISIGVVLFSSCIYYAERSFCPDRSQMTPADLQKYAEECSMSFHGGVGSYGLCCDENDSPNDFCSIIDAFWWAFATMTTVGFGDVYPRTWAGKLVGSVAMLSGILIISLPVAIVGRKFQEIYESYSGQEKSASSAGTGVTAMLKAKGIVVDHIPLPNAPMYGMSNRIRTLRLSEMLEMSEELRELAALFDEADEQAAQMYRLEMVELYRQEEFTRKCEQILGSVLSRGEDKSPNHDPGSPTHDDR